MRKISIPLPLVFCFASAGAALAQAGSAPSTMPQSSAPPAQNCAPTQAMPNDSTIAPSGSTSGQSTEPLTDKLARSDGVLCPPPMPNSGIQVAPPSGGTMQVIPPPGSPGGDPNVRPK